MHTMLKKALCVAVGSLALAAGAQADDAVIGEGHAPLGAGTASAIRNAAKQDAVRDAVLKAIKDATALDASEERFAPIVAEVAKQMRDIRVTSEEAVAGEFVTRVAVNVDRKQIKNAIRGTDLDKLNDRSFGILMLVDEFVTSTRDLNLPLEELVEMKYDAGSSFKDKSIKAASASASANSAVGYSASVNAANASRPRLMASRRPPLPRARATTAWPPELSPACRRARPTPPPCRPRKIMPPRRMPSRPAPLSTPRTWPPPAMRRPATRNWSSTRMRPSRPVIPCS